MYNWKLITKGTLGEILGMSEQGITQKMYKGKEGIDIPFAIKIGNKYKWKLETVKKFIDEKEQLLSKAGARLLHFCAGQSLEEQLKNGVASWIR